MTGYYLARAHRGPSEPYRGPLVPHNEFEYLGAAERAAEALEGSWLVCLDGRVIRGVR